MKILKENNLEQHFLHCLEEYKALLKDLDLRGLTVIEVGVATGQLTQLILNTSKPPVKVIGYEIDAQIVNFQDNRLDLRIKDFQKEDFTYLDRGKYAFIANPPYALLPMIKRLLDKYKFQEIILMISPKYLNLFPDFQICFELSGECFTPRSKGRHLVIKRDESFYNLHPL